MRWFKAYGLYFAWLISLTGVFISLYYGEILNVEPCRLCWYQRASLFPLFLILGIGAFRDDRGILFYALPLAFLGFFIATYQVLEVYFPILRSPALCGTRASCTESVFQIGFLSFPVLSATGFGLLSGLLLFLFCAKNRCD